jgi:competence ComEA-like helix-hairpin-helix protein
MSTKFLARACFIEALKRVKQHGARGVLGMLNRGILLLSLGVPAASCTSRVAYEPSSSAPSKQAVNINTATVDELEKLPYIGRATAEAIVEHREQNGRFRRPEHLMLIRGISETRFAELRPVIKTE